MAEALYLSGKPINWLSPPSLHTKVMWSKKTWTGKPVTGSFRHICHLNRLNNLSKKRFGREIEIIQPANNTGVKASAGTHDYSECVDLYIPGISWWEQQRFFRANGLACWYRHPPKFGNHIHGFTLPPQEGRVRSDDWRVLGIKVGKYVDGGWSLFGRKYYSSQIDDYYNRAFGLSNLHTPGSDKSWFPPDIGVTIFDHKKYINTRAKRARKKKGNKK